MASAFDRLDVHDHVTDTNEVVQSSLGLASNELVELTLAHETPQG